MSFIDTEYVEECVTDVSMDNLEKVLKLYGYDVQRTKYQIVATHGGIITNEHFSTITVFDDGIKRICQDKETAKGYACKPDKGILIEIIKYAESSNEIDMNTNIVHPTTSKQVSLWGFFIGFCILIILGSLLFIKSI